MSDSQPNYREAYFQHPSLTKISGDPTYTSLAKLKKVIKANGNSVPCKLGGGLPFIRPENPILPDLTGGTGPQIATTRQLYAENSAAFKMCNQIERTIIQQIML